MSIQSASIGDILKRAAGIRQAKLEKQADDWEDQRSYLPMWGAMAGGGLGTLYEWTRMSPVAKKYGIGYNGYLVPTYHRRQEALKSYRNAIRDSFDKFYTTRAYAQELMGDAKRAISPLANLASELNRYDLAARQAGSSQNAKRTVKNMLRTLRTTKDYYVPLDDHYPFLVRRQFFQPANLMKQFKDLRDARLQTATQLKSPELYYPGKDFAYDVTPYQSWFKKDKHGRPLRYGGVGSKTKEMLFRRRGAGIGGVLGAVIGKSFDHAPLGFIGDYLSGRSAQPQPSR